MPVSNVARGSYYKSRTRRWLASCGYTVFDMEVVRLVGIPGGKRVPIKRDQLGADLGAMSATELIFVQVKGGKQAVGGGTFPAARREFERFTCPPGVQQWIVAWAPRSREPRIIKCNEQ